MSASDGSEEKKRAAFAINQIGTNALPYLLNWVTNTSPGWKEKVGYASTSVLGTQNNPLFKEAIDASQRPSLRAVAGFQALGTNAMPALQELEEIASLPGTRIEPNPAATLACSCLAAIGQRGLPKLLDLAMEGDEFMQLWASEVILTIGTNAFPAILTFTNMLQNPSPRWRTWGATATGNCENHAEPFLPALTNLLNDPAKDVREAVTNAIRKVVPTN